MRVLSRCLGAPQARSQRSRWFDMPTLPRGRMLRGASSVVALLAIVGAVVWIQLWHGPTLLTLSNTHGLDTGDLLALPFLLLAIAVARVRTDQAQGSGWASPTAALTLGVLLL